MARPRGKDHQWWKGDAASRAAGHARALVLYPDPIFCEVCGLPAERHHKDDNTLNNERENIAFLCRKHHLEADGRMQRPERLAAISERFKGKPKSQAHRDKIRKATTGQKRSPETCARIGDAKRGTILSQEHKEKLSVALTGNKHSSEWRANQSAAVKAWWAERKKAQGK